MKRLFLLSMVFATAYSCNFNKSFKKDFTTGLSVVGDGLSCNDVEISVWDQDLEKPVFNFGDEVAFTFTGMEGFEEQGGAYFPGVEMTVKDAEGNEIYKLDDLFADAKAGIPANKKDLKASLKLASPVFSGEKLKLEVLIWDKKGKGKLQASLDFDLLGNDAIEISGAEDFSYNEIYLFSENNAAVITDNHIARDDKAYLIIDGLTGMVETEGMIYPIVTYMVSDAEGNVIFSSENMFPDNVDSGVKAEEFTKITLSYDKAGHQNLSEVNIRAEIMDQATDKSMVITTKLTIE